MSNILQFPVKVATPGTVLCKPLNVRFPCLYRVHVNCSIEHMAQLFKGNVLPEDLCFEAYERTYFTLEPDMEEIGKVSQTVVTQLNPEDASYSLLIRYHATNKEACEYLDVMADVEFDTDVEGETSSLFETPDGFFTLIKRRTPKAATGPLIIRMARTKGEDPCGNFIDWAHMVSHEGEELDPEDFGY